MTLKRIVIALTVTLASGAAALAMPAEPQESGRRECGIAEIVAAASISGIVAACAAGEGVEARSKSAKETRSDANQILVTK